MTKYFLACLLFTLNVFALESLKIGEGRYVAIENNILDAKKPTLVFLPGINRGLDARDEFIKLAKKAKVNFVSLHFSLHPESVMLIPQGEIPYLDLHRTTSADLADEVLAVISAYKIQKPVVVGLSYSSTVTTELAASGKLPLVIEAAPMIRFDESDPSGSQVSNFWKNYFDLIPGGAFYKDLFLQNIYTQYWSTQADKNLSGYPDIQGDYKLRSRIISGYVSLSIAADGFDFSKQDFTSGTKRLFILGQNELEQRAELQQAAISLYEKQTGYRKTQIVVPNAGHIIPSDAPQAYLNLMKQILKLYSSFAK